MDFGATHCTPRNPNCNNCPLSYHCIGFNTQKNDIIKEEINNHPLKNINCIQEDEKKYNLHLGLFDDIKMKALRTDNLNTDNLIKQSRLSVMPLTKNEFKIILKMGQTNISGL